MSGSGQCSFSQSRVLRQWFERKSINIHDHTIKLDWAFHLQKVHGKCGWNKRWKQFMKEHRDATREEIFEFLEKLKGEYGLKDHPVGPYKRPKKP